MSASILHFPFVPAGPPLDGQDNGEPATRRGASRFVPFDRESRQELAVESRPVTTTHWPALFMLPILVALFYAPVSAVLVIVFGAHLWTAAPIAFGLFAGWCFR